MRKINYLKRVLTVQKAFSKYDDGTRAVVVIWRLHIEPIFNISEPTLRRYLGIKAEKELKELEKHSQSQVNS